MFQRLRDWWTLHSKSAHSPEYDAAMERRMPGFRAIQRQQAADAAERHRQQEAWWQSVVAIQESGRIREASEQTLANLNAIDRFVRDPLEQLATLYAREVDRLLALNDRAGAAAAASEAVRLMSIWASWSTSGGEGTARMNEMTRMDEALQQRLAQHPPPQPHVP